MYEYTTKKDFEALAELRMDEGKALLDKKFYAGAYYLLGYAVECALKACICKHIKRNHIPHKKFVDKFFDHNLEKLLNLSGDKTKKFQKRMKKDPVLDRHWSSIVIKWKETVRYNPNVEPENAKYFYKALTDDEHGVLTWLKKCW
jgi:hypothetical protein